MNNLQLKTWVAAVGVFVIMQIGVWASYFLLPSKLPMLPFAAITFAASALFVLVGFLLLRFVPAEKRMRWGIPIMSAIVVFDVGVVVWELANGTMQSRNIVRFVLHIGVLTLLWWFSNQRARTQREEELKS